MKFETLKERKMGAYHTTEFDRGRKVANKGRIKKEKHSTRRSG